MSKVKIYCANCSNCIVIRMWETDSGRYSLRVKCSKKQWNKRSGEEKLYKYFTVARRTVAECGFFNESGDLYPFIKNLMKDLPVRDELYSAAVI